jgi:hypothetical protein
MKVARRSLFFSAQTTRSWVIAAACVCMVQALVARADEVVSGAAVAQAIEAGAPGKAIALAEALADRGFVSPELAYHRGLAYASRLATADEAPGDGGQAMAAFLDADALGASGDVASRVEAGLKSVRSHLARKRSLGGLSAMVEPSPGLRRAALLALPVTLWLALGGAASLVSALMAMLAWRSERGARSTTVAAAVLCAGLGVAFSLAGYFAQGLRSGEAVMVVVSGQAPLFDASTGALTEDEALGEGLPVRVNVSDSAMLTLADRTDRALRRDQLRGLQSQR